ncbi:MAG TPA: FHA domain-containing protein [Anaerolineaceae bacterium]
MTARKIVLRYSLKAGKWREFQPASELVTLGRAPDCDLVIEHETLSRHHARLAFMPEGIYLVDLGSTNGTRLDGKPIPPRCKTTLMIGQVFNCGGVTCVLAEQYDEADSPQELPMPKSDLAHLPQALSGGDTAHTVLRTQMPAEPVASATLDLTLQEKITIGRAPDNTLVLKHPLVSRYHAMLERVGARLHLVDLRSTNGVYVNNKRVEHEAWLKENDRITLGPYEFSLHGYHLHQATDQGLLLEAIDLNQVVGKRLNLLQNINLTIRPMEFVAVVGMSGSGKTTLLNTLSGYFPASSGKVLVNGVDLYQHYDQFRDHTGIVPQKDIVHSELTPFSALEYAARLRMPPDTTRAERLQAVEEVLAELDLSERKDVPIGKLSGGQIKRVSIGVELLTRPRLFYLDEPTSGLDPGTEYEMMLLLRKLADQGRTVILVTHATKNVMLCDKVLFLARGGHLAFFGAPEEALEYFDPFRTARERQQKQMEFDDIYRILNDPQRGSPAEWGARFMASDLYRAVIGRGAGTPRREIASATRTRQELAKLGRRKKASMLRQFWVLSSRNLKILAQDRVSLGLMLLLAPVIGLMDFMWGGTTYDPVHGDPVTIVTMWFMTALIVILVGALSSVREIVKESEIYRRERAVNLRIVPYILSKIWVGVVLAFYQAGVLMITRLLFNHPALPGLGGYLALYLTLFLGTLCGYLIGLGISAGAPNQNAAMLLIIVVLVPQFLFAGALLPLDLIPGGDKISLFMPTRWTFEAFLNLSGIGDTLIQDSCWALPKAQRSQLSEAQKENCPCMGANIFQHCASFPGVLSPDYFSPRAAQALNSPPPVEPSMPTAIPYPTALPSPTPLPTPTLRPSPTPLPTPTDPRKLQEYMDQRQEQGRQYQEVILKQFEDYRADSERQGQQYSSQRTRQGDEYAALRQRQGDEYERAMRAYGDERSAYEEIRQKAIGSAEGILETIYDNYGRAFRGNVWQRWGILVGLMGGISALLLYFQKRKDVV